MGENAENAFGACKHSVKNPVPGSLRKNKREEDVLKLSKLFN